jgi:hypothetical protein
LLVSPQCFEAGLPDGLFAYQFGLFWRALEWIMLVYFTAICCRYCFPYALHTIIWQPCFKVVAQSVHTFRTPLYSVKNFR